MDIEQIKRANEQAGQFFFQPKTLRFFSSRILSDVFEGPGGVFFVTSEKRGGHLGDGPRRFTVRRFMRNTGNVITHGEFVEYQTAAQAKCAAKRAAAGK